MAVEWRDDCNDDLLEGEVLRPVTIEGEGAVRTWFPLQCWADEYLMPNWIYE